MGHISNVYVKSSGHDGASLLIIGEAPGSDETRLKQPFVGRSGELLRQVLNNSGIYVASADESSTIGRSVNDPYSVKFANLCNYQPADNNFGYLDGSEELKQGLEELREYIDKYKKDIKLILLLGPTPLQYMCKKYDITNWRGSVIQQDGLTFLPTYHPSYVSRVRSKYPVFSFDIERAANILRNGYTPPKFSFDINPDAYKLEDLLDESLASKSLTIDIETVKNTNRIICAGLGLSRSRAICVVNSSDSGLDTSFRKFFSAVLENKGERRLTYHNGLFDAEIFRNNGLEAENFQFDTMIAQHVIAPELPKSLDFITSIYTDIPYYKDRGRTALPENEKGWGKLKDEDRLNVYEYNCLDCCATYWCQEKMFEEIEGDADLKRIFDYEMSMHEVSFHLTHSGMLSDEERRLKLQEVIEARYVKEQALLNKIVGYYINVGSPAQKKKLLYEFWKLPERTNKKSIVSTDEDALVSLISYVQDYADGLKTQEKKFEWQKKLVGIKTILKLVGYRKLLGSYIEAEKHQDGRWRSVYKISGTETGRWACSKYYDDTGWNATTLPRESIEE